MLAVIPTAFGPLQALLAVLPHLLALLLALLLAVFRPRTYRALYRYVRAHPLLALGAVLLAGLLGLRAWSGRGGAAPVGPAAAGARTDWPAFRGGADRCGARPGEHGPQRAPRILWRYQAGTTGRLAFIDSSPAVVGGRVYFGLGLQTPFSQSGALAALDAESGGLLWQYAGAGALEPRLRPVFSSPALGGVSAATGAPARYLVCGEGYHDDARCRIVCLDLAPAEGGGRAPPRLAWARETASHVESSPGLLDGRIFIGAGDDGLWSVELESGRTLWHLEGARRYELAAGASAEALARLEGRTVLAVGTVRTEPPEARDAPARLILSVREFRELPGPLAAPPTPPPGDERAVVGRVVRLPTDAARTPGSAEVGLEPAEFYPDVESAPIAVRDGPGGADCVVFGCGVGGPAVVCVEAASGRLRWRREVELPVFGEPSVADGRVLVGLSNGTFDKSAEAPAGAVLALALADGAPLWRHDLPDGVIGAVAVRDGTAYAGSRDGALYAFAAADGRLVGRYAAGAPIVASPAVAEATVYLATAAGRVVALDRATLSRRWSLDLTPDEPICSSPAVVGDRLIVAGRGGVFCLAEGPAAPAGARAPRVWSGPGGDAGRTGVAPEDATAGPAATPGTVVALAADAAGPLAACGEALYVALDKLPDATGRPGLARFPARSGGLPAWRTSLAGPARALVADERVVGALVEEPAGPRLCVFAAASGAPKWDRAVPTATGLPSVLALADGRLFLAPEAEALGAFAAETGKELWQRPLGRLAGPPALAHGLVCAAVAAPEPQMLCLDDASGAVLWTTRLSVPPLGPPSVAGAAVYAAFPGSTPARGRVVAFRLTDGAPLWERETARPVSHLAVAGGRVAFAAVAEQVIVLSAEGGEPVVALPAGRGLQPPALLGDRLLLAADGRLGRYDFAAADRAWRLPAAERLGALRGPPLVAGRTVSLVGTDGLVQIGLPEIAGEAGEDDR